MNTKEAIASVQGLRNLFRGLEKLEEVLRVVQAADTALSEKAALVAQAEKERAEAVGLANEAKSKAARDIEQARREAANTITVLRQQVANTQKKADEARKAIEFQAKSFEEGHTVRVATLTAEVKSLQLQKDQLTSQVGDLSARLDSLKNRISAA